MWFEADPVFPYSPTNDLPLSEPGFDPGPLASDARSALPDTRAAFERDDFSGRLRFSAEWSDLGGLFSPFPTNANDFGEAVTTKDGGRVMNEDTIVVTGTRYSRLDTYSWWDSGPGADFWTVQLDGGGGFEREPECNRDGLTEVQRQEQAIDAEAADILREILAQANQNMEYGSLIWRDSSGVLQHTPLISTPDERARIDTSTLPTLPDGRTDFSGVVAMVHSHPGYIASNNTTYYDADNPNYLLTPWTGDWASYDGYAALITSAGGNASTFEQYIIGWDGQNFVIKEYDTSDRGTDTSDSGETVAPDTEAPTC